MPCSVSNPIERDYIGDRSWGLHERFDFDTEGRGIHAARDHETFRQGFWEKCDSWARSVNVYTTMFRPAGEPEKEVAWWGHVGVVGHCEKTTFSWHQEGRAFDLTKVLFTDDSYIDMNWSWRQGQRGNRRYLGIAAHCRMNFGTVLTRWYNTLHHNHIHFDNGIDVTPIRDEKSESDATLVQAACNVLNGESIAIDGAWGSQTEAAFNRLLGAFDMACLQPKRDLAHALLFLSYITRHGLADRSAGYYKYGC